MITQFGGGGGSAVGGSGGIGDALKADPLSQFGATTSAQLAGVISDETGTGLLVFGTNPTIVTPTIASFVNSTHNHTNAAGGGTLAEAALALTDVTTANASTSAHGLLKKLDNNAGHFLDGTGAWTTPAGGGDALTTSPLSQFAATTSAQLAGVISNETGSGALVFATTPTFVTPVLGAATGTSIALGGGTALATTNQTGTGNLVLASSPTIVTPTIADLTNATHTHANNAGGGQITDAALSAAVGITKGGTGQTTKAPAFDALQPMTTAGDFIYGGASGTGTRLAAGTGFLYANGASAPTIAKFRRVFGFTFGDPAGSALSTSTVGYIVCPVACTIVGWDILVDAGTATVTTWKVATGTAIPTVSNTISTSGVAISTGTAIHSTTTSDFTTTTIAANDIIAFNISAVATAKYLFFQIQADQ